MEELNKNQIVLLTLLVSFVTSIATGIVTVTLMDQAPAAVTQTVNRVVERTIERVVPGEPTERVVVKEVPVEVTQEDLVQTVINSSLPGLVRVARRNTSNLGSGFVFSDDGLVVTAAHLLPELKEGERYTIQLRSDDILNARLLKFSTASDLALIKIDAGELAVVKQRLLAAAAVAAATSTPALAWQPLELYEGEITLGQTVVALGSPDAGPVNVALGIISAINDETVPPARRLQTSAANQLNLGGPILSIKGKVIGLSQTPGNALDLSSVKSFISS